MTEGVLCKNIILMILRSGSSQNGIEVLPRSYYPLNINYSL